MEVNKIYEGTCLDVIKTFPNKSIDCVITSPPYWQLRDYGWSGQWGMEPTFQMYLENLWSLMDEIWRVLKDEGTVWINLGDTYGTKSGSMGASKKYKSKETSYCEKSIDFKQSKSIDKCLLMIPHRFAIGCIDRGWIMRNDIIWAKRNGMPESVTDRFSKKHEYIFFMTKKEKYYFDLDAIRGKHKYANDKRNDGNRHPYLEGAKSNQNEMLSTNAVSFHENGKNPGSVSDFWNITTKGSSVNHYATFNTDLINKPIVAGCPRGGLILDPFCGTATTVCRSIELGRNAIGIEGSADYIKIANKNLSPLLMHLNIFGQ